MLLTNFCVGVSSGEPGEAFFFLGDGDEFGVLMGVVGTFVLVPVLSHVNGSMETPAGVTVSIVSQKTAASMLSLLSASSYI